jgi:hypothetical protein
MILELMKQPRSSFFDRNWAMVVEMVDELQP